MLASVCKSFIRLYWYFVPKEKRIVCLYKDHCSQHVYNAFDQKGFIFGIKALRRRFKSCNNRYTCVLQDNVIKIKTATGETIESNDISDLVFKGCQAIVYK